MDNQLMLPQYKLFGLSALYKLATESPNDAFKMKQFILISALFARSVAYYLATILFSTRVRKLFTY